MTDVTILHGIYLLYPMLTRFKSLMHRPLTRYVKYGLHIHRGCGERFPHHRFQRKPLVSMKKNILGKYLSTKIELYHDIIVADVRNQFDK